MDERILNEERKNKQKQKERKVASEHEGHQRYHPKPGFCASWCANAWPKKTQLGTLTGAETGALCIGHDATGQQCSVPGCQWLDHSILMGRHPLDFTEMSIGSCHES